MRTVNKIAKNESFQYFGSGRRKKIGTKTKYFLKNLTNWRKKFQTDQTKFLSPSLKGLSPFFHIEN